jgi:hypothetical protein
VTPNHEVRDFVLVLIAVAVLAWLALPGLRWGLPSEERNRLTLGEDRSAWRAPPMSERERESPWEYYPNNLSGGPARAGASPRSSFNPLRSYHPDEYVFLKSLSAMRPSRLKLFTGFFGWPALQFYVSGVALEVSSWFGAVTLVRDMDFYFQHPEKAARLYEVGRIVTLLFAVGCILVVWRAAGRLFGPAGGIAAALLLAVAPLFTINARYWTADVPMLFWISLALLFSTHILGGGGTRWYVLAGIALGLAAATRYQGAAAAFLIAAAHLGRPGAGNGQLDGARRFSPLRDLWIAAGLSVLIFLVCDPYVMARPGQFLREFSGELRGSHGDWAQFAIIGPLSVASGLGLMFFFAVVAACLLVALRGDRAIWFVLLGFGPPALILLVGRSAMARYWLPVLLLPVLLVAWAFAAMHRQGIALGRPGSKVGAPILLLIVLIATGLQSFAFARLYSDPKCDTRTRAGEWIAQHIPAGSTVAVPSEPWQFDLPPLDARKFVIRTPESSKAREPANYLVMSDLEFAPEDRLQRETDFMSGYDVIERFEAWPAAQKALLQHGPQDMHYENPAITVAERISKGRR